VTESYGAVNTRVGRTAGGKYRLVRLLGSGGMGEVYEAQHAAIGRRFAIKFLHSLLASNGESVARFQREAQAAGGLENENIAAVVDIGTADDGAPFLVMEYLDGEDLAKLLVRSGPLSVPRAAYIIIQACRGLAAAHSRGIVHRDLKPENLFICKRNDGSDLVKVLDFGIAKLHTGRLGTGITQTGTTMGTPFYMSLEQARGAKEVDHRTDIYALGVILYEILSGAKPHPGESYNEILYHVLSKEPAPLAECLSSQSWRRQAARAIEVPDAWPRSAAIRVLAGKTASQPSRIFHTRMRCLRYPPGRTETRWPGSCSRSTRSQKAANMASRCAAVRVSGPRSRMMAKGAGRIGRAVAPMSRVTKIRCSAAARRQR
jgi:serine/threonine protein kinase